MKVKIKTIMAGPDGSYMPGDEPDLSGVTTQDLIAGGFAEAIEEPVIKHEEPAETDSGTPEHEDPNPVLEDMALAELRDLAKAFGIDGHKMNKATLIKALSARG
ncbi:MAG: hypothetical protein A4E53_02360 [Pelotomaculum sp. PtaB.Bin104]|nr:MAG: hypothetical protein A4E53_02360 [Pelotomaculum sp. PtaB.Bin104]